MWFPSPTSFAIILRDVGSCSNFWKANSISSLLSISTFYSFVIWLFSLLLSCFLGCTQSKFLFGLYVWPYQSIISALNLSTFSMNSLQQSCNSSFSKTQSETETNKVRRSLIKSQSQVYFPSFSFFSTKPMVTNRGFMYAKSWMPNLGMSSMLRNGQMFGAFLMSSKNCFVRSLFYFVSSFISANVVKSIKIILARPDLKQFELSIYHTFQLLAQKSPKVSQKKKVILPYYVYRWQIINQKIQMTMHEKIQMDKIIKPAILRAIVDKNEQKRRYGRVQLERLIYEYATRYSPEIVEQIIKIFSVKYLKSSDISKKIVGLQVMTSVISAIQTDQKVLRTYDEKIITCILRCLNDSQCRIRLMAIKVLFEITRLLNQRIIRLFNLIFQKMIGCINDVEETVRDSCIFLNSTLKGIVLNVQSNHEELNFPGFVSILKLKMKTMNFQVRKFLLGWIRQIMELDLYIYFPDFLEDLLLMISEKQLEDDVSQCLSIFQSILKEKFHDGTLEEIVGIDYIDNIITILIKVAKSKSSGYTKFHTLIWFQLIFIFFRQQILNKASNMNRKNYFKKIVIERFDQILEPILLLMSNQEQQVRKESINSNDILMQAIVRMERDEPINFIKVLPIIKQVLSQKRSTNTSQYAINWVKFMLQSYHEKITPQIKEITEKIMEKIYESNGRNIFDIIQNMKMKQQYCNILIEKMLQFLFQKGIDNQSKVEIMIKKFIGSRDSYKFLTVLCTKMQDYKDKPKFVYQIANNLNAIIVNEDLMVSIRKELNNWSTPRYKEFFMMIYESLKYSPPAAISLCLLSQQYQLALKIINTLNGKYQISSSVLMGLCKLVSLLERPAFLFLRMQILSQDNEELLECLNELLMILPQGKIFNMLRNRLDSQNLSKTFHQGFQNKGENPIDIEACFRSYQETFGLNR